MFPKLILREAIIPYFVAKGPMCGKLGFSKVWGWAVGRSLNLESKKIQIFQSLGVVDNAGMSGSAAKYGIIF